MEGKDKEDREIPVSSIQLMPLHNINPPEQFNFVPTTWEDWKTRFTRYMSISGQDIREDEEKINIFIYVLGGKAEQLYRQLKLKDRTYEEVLKAFDSYFIPRKNVIYERFKFNSRIQGEAEEFDEFVRQLYVLADTCEYNELKEELIRDRIVVGIRDRKTSERLQLVANLTLEEAIRVAKQAEEQGQAKILLHREHEEHEINRMQRKKQCWWCGRMGVHKKEQCPAAKTICHKCKKIGHYARCCRDWKKVNQLEVEEDFQIEIQVHIGSSLKTVKFLIDTGADIVALPNSILGKHCKLLANNEIIRGPDGRSLKVVGYSYLKLSYKSSVFEGKVFFIDNLKTPILGRPAIKQMNILKLCNIQVMDTENNIIRWQNKYSDIEKEFPGIFDELGVFKDVFKITLIENPKPFVQYTPRVVPIPLLSKVKQELDILVKLDVLTSVEEPTMFVSPIVVVPKGENGVRICGDYTQVNKNILRPIYPIPKVETTLGRLKGAKIFSKIDATSGFYQICLDKESRKITTILTPFGRYMYKRLPMGLNCAPEYFSMKYSQLFSDLEGVVLHVDDLLIYAKDRESHDKLLKEVLRRLSKEGLTINKEKCIFGVDRIAFLGHIISSQGISLDPDRIESIKQFKQPKNKKELMQFLGLVNYVGRFVPDKTNILQPLNELLKDNTVFVWGYLQESAFQRIKEMIQKSPILSHYDTMKKVIISADSSSYGLGAVLMQESDSGQREIVSYASRTLNNSEKNYAQIEKECLALAWSVHKFRDYVVGIEVTLETDHKPLVQILQTKPIDDLTPKLLRFRLQLMRYTYKVIYVPGKKLVVADALSRAPLPHIELKENDYHINVITSGIWKDNKLLLIKEEQQKCQICSLIKKFTIQGWPHKNKVPKELNEYYQYRHNFSVQDNFLLFNSRLVIPKILQKDILNYIHEGHLGITKCKERAKQAVWWLGLSTQIKVLIENCEKCIQERHNKKEPLLLEQSPCRAWQKIGIDLFKYEEKWYVVFVDFYSRFIELYQLRDLTEGTIIKHCKETFARFGIPEIVRTDCGTQFKSKFKEFANDYNFDHVTSSPYFSQSNGCAEAAVKTVKNLLKKNSDIYLALLIYRNTPLETGYSPSELMFNRKLREILPMYPKNLKMPSEVHSNFVKKNTYYKEKMAENYNKRHKVINLKEFSVGDRVWIIDMKKYGCIKRKAKEPRSYFVEVDGVMYRRNRWHLIPAPFYGINKNVNVKNSVNENLQSSLDYTKVIVNDDISNNEDSVIIDNHVDVRGSRELNVSESPTNVTINTEPVNTVQRFSERVKQKPKWMEDYIVD